MSISEICLYLRDGCIREVVVLERCKKDKSKKMEQDNINHIKLNIFLVRIWFI